MKPWSRVALAMSVLVFLPGLREDFEVPKTAAVRLCGVAVLAFVAASWRTLRRISWTPLDFAVLAWLATELAATVFSSAPILSLLGEPEQREGFLTSLAIAALYLGARAGTRDAAEASRTLDIAIAAATVASLYALLQAAGFDPIPWAPAVVAGFPTAVGRPFGTLGHPNLLGVVSAAAAAAAWGRAAAPDRWRLAYAAAGVLCAAATLFTLSRAAWLGLAGGSIVTATLLALAGSRLRMSRRAALAGAAVALLVAVGIAAGSWGPKLATRFAEIFDPSRGSGAARLEIWRAAFAAGVERPWLGWGPDTFAMIFPRFQTAEFWRHEWAALPLHAHSIYLNALATRGLAGIAAGAVWCVTLGLALRRAWRAAPADRALVAGLAGMLVALGIAGGFGALGITGAVLVAVASGLAAARAVPPPAEPSSRRATEFSIVASALAAAMLVSGLIAAAAAFRADAWLAGANAADWNASSVARERALGEASRAAAFAPYDDAMELLRADALLVAAESSPEPMPRLVEATGAARRALRLVSGRAQNQTQLARVLTARVEAGDAASRPEAEAAIDRTVAMAPVNALILNECARMELALGNASRALPIARRVTSLYPEDGPSQLMLARLLVASGDRGAAVQALRRAVAGQWHGDLAGKAAAERGLQRLGP